MVDLESSIAEFSKIDNESILPESEVNLDEHDEDNNQENQLKVQHDENRNDISNNEVEKRVVNTPKKDKRPVIKTKKGINPDTYKYQELDLSVYGRHLIGFRTKFNEYLEDIEVYTVKTPDVQDYIIR